MLQLIDCHHSQQDSVYIFPHIEWKDVEWKRGVESVLHCHTGLCGRGKSHQVTSFPDQDSLLVKTDEPSYSLVTIVDCISIQSKSVVDCKRGSFVSNYVISSHTHSVSVPHNFSSTTCTCFHILPTKSILKTSSLT